MSNNDEFDDDTETVVAAEEPKDLRKQRDVLSRKVKELETELGTFRLEKRKSSVADALKAKGADPGYAEFYTADDSSEEAVNAWITKHAEKFGVGSDDQGADQETINAAARISQGLSSAPPVKPGNAEALLTEFATTTDPKRHQELKAALAQMTPTQ